MTNEEFEQACRLIVRMGALAARHGLSAPRLEAVLTRMPETMGFSGMGTVTTRAIDCVFWRRGAQRQYHYVEPLSETSFDLTKLASLGALVNQLERGEVPVAELSARLDEVERLRPPYGNGLVGLGYALSGAGFAVLLSAAWIDVMLSALLSLFVFGVSRVAERVPWLKQRFELLVALVVAMLANVAAILVAPGSNTFVVSLCAVIVIVPGLMLTQGISELLEKSILSGASRLIDGALITIKLFLGAAMGRSLVAALHAIPRAAQPDGLPSAFTWVAAIALIFALALVFQVRPRDVGWATVAGALAYAGTKLGTPLGFWQGSFVGALFLGIYANVFYRLRRLPQEVVILPGIMILVPGAAAYLGLATLQTSGVLGGLAAFGRVLIQIGAIFGGLVVAASIVPAKFKPILERHRVVEASASAPLRV